MKEQATSDTPAPLRPDPRSLAERFAARNYSPLPVTIAEAQGSWVVDTDGHRYLDMLAAYSAVNFGHRHPALVAAARRQLSRVTLTSRAFHNDQLGPFCAALAETCGMDLVLPMNTGAEAVETALKLARKWGQEVKGVPPGRGRIVVCADNFHGRTITIVSFSTDESAREGFGPYTPGFDVIPFGDAPALEAAITDDTVAFLFEPIQGEAGVRIPPAGWLGEVRRICTERGILMIADEIQSGFGRTGSTFACDAEGVRPDVYVLGKALGGGLVPLSAVVADEEVLGVFRPGEHGSTFGGNPLACAVGLEVLRLVASGEYQARAARLGPRLVEGIRVAAGPSAREVRGRGLWVAADLDPAGPSGREVCEGLVAEGVLAKDTHGHTVRFAPPLVITEHEIDWALERIGRVVSGSASSCVA